MNDTPMDARRARSQASAPKTFNVLRGKAFFRPFWAFLKELPQDYVGTLAKVQSHHGDLVHWRIFGGVMHFAFISDAEVNRELYVRNVDALNKSPSQIQTFLYAAGPSVATAHGEAWRIKRKEANSLFSRKIIEASCAGQVAVVRDYIDTLGPAPLDAILLARRLAAFTSSRGILGHAITQTEADVQIAFSKAAADRFNVESGQVFPRPHWMLAPWRKELTRRKNEVFPIVQKAIEALRGTDTPNDGLMNHYVNGAFVTSNDAEMRTILVGLLMGAQDNVAAAAGWCLAFLAHHPKLQAEIQSEIQDLGDEAADLHKASLLKATLLEVLRARPPAPANQPRLLKQSVEIAGYTLPKGTFIFNSFYNMHHNPEVFAEPQVFDPTRFFDESLVRSSSMVPFGHGARNCVAQGMATQQLMALVVGILRGYRITARDEHFPQIEQNPFLCPAPFEINLEKV